MTRQVHVGPVAIGGGAPVSIQSMCNTPTENEDATVAQILRLEQAGCDIVRVAVPTREAAMAIPVIKSRIHIPLVADIHFDYKLALLCIGVCVLVFVAGVAYGNDAGEMFMTAISLAVAAIPEGLLAIVTMPLMVLLFQMWM